jgi:hypothetical protein
MIIMRRFLENYRKNEESDSKVEGIQVGKIHSV